MILSECETPFKIICFNVRRLAIHNWLSIQINQSLKAKQRASPIKIEVTGVSPKML